MKQLLIGAVMLQVFAVGTQTAYSHVFTCVRPRTLTRIVLAMFVAVPALAALIVKSVAAPQEINVALGAVAISAAAPLLPRKLLKVGVDAAYAESLSAVTTVLAIPFIPLMAAALGIEFSRVVNVPLFSLMTTLAITFVVPFAIGMVLHARLGSSAARVGGWAAAAGMVILVTLGAVVLFAVRASLVPMFREGWLSIALFSVGALLIGHALGGPDPGERTALALAAVTRHPGLAVLLATTNFPELRVLPALLVVILGYTVVAVPYTIWRRRLLAGQPKPLRAANVAR